MDGRELERHTTCMAWPLIWWLQLSIRPPGSLLRDGTKTVLSVRKNTRTRDELNLSNGTRLLLYFPIIIYLYLRMHYY